MAQATFSYDGINIRATVEREEDIQWLREFLVPWYDISNDIPDVEVRVARDPTRFGQLMACGPGNARVNAFMMDTRLIDFPLWNVPAEQLAFYDEKHQLFYLVTDNQIQLVISDHGIDTRMSVMRVLRELAMGVAQLRGGRFLHASAFVANGRTAIITGPRQAGKTSLLSYVLSSSGANFLCNDRLLINRHGHSTRLRGMPTIVSIRDGTMDLFPGMRQSIEDQCFTSRATMAESRQLNTLASFPIKDGRRGLSPHQFCSLLDCEPEKEASGTVLLFPRQTGRTGGIVLRRVDTSEARSRLGNCLFGHIGPDRLSDAFTTLPQRLDRAAAPDDAALCAGLADTLPAFDCELGNDTYNCSAGVIRLLQLLGNPDIAEPDKPVSALYST
jgi:hypothetical protein